MAISEISVEQLAVLIEQGDDGLRVVDVREVDEWEAGRIPAAVHVPLATVPDQLDAFGSDGAKQPTYVVCKVGGRSFRACEFAAAQGKHVVNVSGGMLAWSASGGDVVVGA